MGNRVRNLLRKNPRVFDLAKSCQMLFAKKDATWKFFDTFSKAHGGRATFLYIGANDGLRSDPIRYFIVRDRWQGILVEPLPDVFLSLKSNFSYLKKSRLVFVNAAITSDNSAKLSFWTFDDKFLDALNPEERINYLRKSSFDKNHVRQFLDLSKLSEDVLREIKVPCLTVSALVREHWSSEPINLIVMDAEGHEASIIPSIDLKEINAEGIYFESHNLGPNKARVYGHLQQNGYHVYEVGGDSIALQKTSPLAGKLDLGNPSASAVS
jgi:FkbM family methyltransferase